MRTDNVWASCQAVYTHKTIISIREGKTLKFTEKKAIRSMSHRRVKAWTQVCLTPKLMTNFLFLRTQVMPKCPKPMPHFFFYLLALSLSKMTISFILYLKHIIFLFHKIWELEDTSDTTIPLYTHWRPEMITEWPVQDQRNVLVNKLGIDAQTLWLLVQPGNM